MLPEVSDARGAERQSRILQDLIIFCYQTERSAIRETQPVSKNRDTEERKERLTKSKKDKPSYWVSNAIGFVCLD